MRPRGEIRTALASATEQLTMERAGIGCTWRDAAARALVGFDLARRTLENMAAAGELAKVGQVTVPGARRPMTLYRPTRGNWVTDTTGPLDLQAVFARR